MLQLGVGGVDEKFRGVIQDVALVHLDDFAVRVDVPALARLLHQFLRFFGIRGSMAWRAPRFFTFLAHIYDDGALALFLYTEYDLLSRPSGNDRASFWRSEIHRFLAQRSDELVQARLASDHERSRTGQNNGGRALFNCNPR